MRTMRRPWPRATPQGAGDGATLRGLQPPVETWQRNVHPVIHVRMVVVELFVHMVDPGLVQSLRKDPRPVMDVVLVARPTIDIDTAKGLQVPLMLCNEVYRVVVAPALPALGDQLAGLQVERQAESVRRLGIRIVGGRHAE